MSNSASRSEAPRAGGYCRPPSARRFGAVAAAFLLLAAAGMSRLSSGAPVARQRDGAHLKMFDVPLPPPITGRAPAPALPRAQTRNTFHPAPRAPAQMRISPIPATVAAQNAPPLPVAARPPVLNVATPPVPAAAAPPAEPAAADVRAEYAARLWKHIATFRGRGIRLSGTALLGFTVSADGAIGQVRIVSGSGNAMLDQLALRAVRRASPAPAPPAKLGSEPAFTISFSFD